MSDLREALHTALAAHETAATTGVRAAEEAELRAHFAESTESERAREFYYDSNTGLPDERAWKVMQESNTGPQLYAQYSIEGVAWVNDTFGHDPGQLLFRVAADALHQVDSRVAKVRADFAGRVDSLEDAAARASMATAKLPPEFQGFKITAATGSTWREACVAHHASKDESVAAGVRAERKTPPLGLHDGWTPALPAHWPLPTSERPIPGRVEQPLYDELAKAYRKLEPDVAFQEAYRDPLTGLLAHTGMGVTEQPGHHLLSIDIDGLRATDEFESRLGDEVLRRVGAVMTHLQDEQGEALYAAHPHGDEFGASHPSERLLRQYGEHVREVLAHETVRFTDPETALTYVQHGIGMSYGVGPSHDLAEAELKHDKAKRVGQGERDGKEPSEIAHARLQVFKASPHELQAAQAAVQYTLTGALLEAQRRVPGPVAFVSADWKEHSRIRVQSPQQLIENVERLRTAMAPEARDMEVYTVRDDGTVHNTVTERDEYLRVDTDTRSYPQQLEQAVARHFRNDPPTLGTMPPATPDI